MFDFKRKIQPLPTNISPESGGGEKTAQTTAAIGPGFDVSGIKVHAMPDKFLAGSSARVVSQGAGKTTPGKIIGLNKNIFIGLIIGIVIIGTLSLAGWFLLKSIEVPRNKNLLVNQNVSQEQPLANVVEEQETALPPAPELPAAVCSPEHCELCTAEECNNLSQFCHLEDTCQIEGNEIMENCPQYVCTVGPKKEEPILPEELKMSQDSDSDLLVDLEEGLWGTNPLESDSDSDGFNDGVEIMNLYDPNVAGSGTGKLLESNLIKTYTSTKFGYSIYYPTSWQVQDLSEAGEEIMFKSATGEFIEVIVEKNQGGFLLAKDWYLNQNSAVKASDLEEILIGNWAGVKSPDKLNVYLVNNNYIYTITMNIGLKQELNYKTTYEMMLKSFRLFESPL